MYSHKISSPPPSSHCSPLWTSLPRQKSQILPHEAGLIPGLRQLVASESLHSWGIQPCFAVIAAYRNTSPHKRCRLLPPDTPCERHIMVQASTAWHQDYRNLTLGCNRPRSVILLGSATSKGFLMCEALLSVLRAGCVSAIAVAGNPWTPARNPVVHEYSTENPISPSISGPHLRLS